MAILTIRPATQDDLTAITEIYNDAVVKTTATFDTEPKSERQQRPWFEAHGERYPILVAELDGAVVGWASLSRWSDRCAYSETAEDSVYVAESHRGRGLGKKLLAALLDRGKAAGLRTVLARITQGNPTSIKLHEAHGFESIGTMRQVGRKFGRLLDVHMLQKIF